MHARSPRRPPLPSPRTFIAAGVVSAVLLGYIAPVSDLMAQRNQLVREQHELEQMKAVRRSLQAQLRSTQRADVLERRARAQGAIKPGERAFIVESPAPDDPADGSVPGG